MNSLSWFLLLIDFYGNFQLFCLTVFWVLVIKIGVSAVVGFVIHADNYPKEPDDLAYSLFD